MGSENHNTDINRKKKALLLCCCSLFIAISTSSGFADPDKNPFTLSDGEACDVTNRDPTGVSSVELGGSAQATGTMASAIGGCAHAKAQGASAFGYRSNANQPSATAVGEHAIANGIGSLAVGSGAGVDKDSADAIAIGTRAYVGELAASSMAIGREAKVDTKATNALAIGDGSEAKNSNSVALGSNSETSAAVQTTGTKIGDINYNFAGINPDSTISIGNKGKERTLTNLAAGRISGDSTDAVNGSELYATNQAVTLANEHFNAFGANVASILGGGSSFGSDGSLTAPTYNIGGHDYSSIGETFRAVNNSLDDMNKKMAGLEDISKRDVQYDPNPDGTNSPDVTLKGPGSVPLAGGDPGAPVKIHNAADGVADTDVTNVRQLKKVAEDAHSYADIKSTETLKDAKSYTDNVLKDMDHRMDDKLSMLSGRVDNVEKEARQAAAIGLAASSLRYDDRPGKVSAAIGGGAWQGEGAFAAGLGYTSENQRMRLNVAATNAGQHWGVGGGVSFTFN